MTKEDAKDYLPHVEALRDGELQMLDLDNVWRDITVAHFTGSPERYRRKPKPIEAWAIVDKNGKPCALYYTNPEVTDYYEQQGFRIIKLIEAND